MIADWLSKYGHTNQITAEVTSSLHRELHKIVWDDVTRGFCEKRHLVFFYHHLLL